LQDLEQGAVVFLGGFPFVGWELGEGVRVRFGAERKECGEGGGGDAQGVHEAHGEDGAVGEPAIEGGAGDADAGLLFNDAAGA
jgi:hypothetical protein